MQRDDTFLPVTFGGTCSFRSLGEHIDLKKVKESLALIGYFSEFILLTCFFLMCICLRHLIPKKKNMSVQDYQKSCKLVLRKWMVLDKTCL